MDLILFKNSAGNIILKDIICIYLTSYTSSLNFILSYIVSAFQNDTHLFAFWEPLVSKKVTQPYWEAANSSSTLEMGSVYQRQLELLLYSEANPESLLNKISLPYGPYQPSKQFTNLLLLTHTTVNYCLYMYNGSISIVNKDKTRSCQASE